MSQNLKWEAQSEGEVKTWTFHLQEGIKLWLAEYPNSWFECCLFVKVDNMLCVHISGLRLSILRAKPIYSNIVCK